MHACTHTSTHLQPQHHFSCSYTSVCVCFARACLCSILPVSPSATACVSLPSPSPPSPKVVCSYFLFLSPRVSKQYNVVCLESVSERRTFKLPYCYAIFADMIIGKSFVSQLRCFYAMKVHRNISISISIDRSLIIIFICDGVILCFSSKIHFKDHKNASCGMDVCFPMEKKYQDRKYILVVVSFRLRLRFFFR